MNRRDFIAATLGAGGFVVSTTLRLEAAQAPAQTMSGPMDASAHRPVKLPPRAGASPQLNDEAVKTLELGLKCQCPCRLDVYACRTTDLTCPVSPAMHRDVLALVAGGYGAAEIVQAFVDVYGERVRMAPPATGFNIVAYVLPFIAITTAALLVGMWIMKNLRRQRDANTAPKINVSTNASPEELQELERALKDDR